MIQDILIHLDIAPRGSTALAAGQRTRLVNFLVRWEYYQAVLACLEFLVAVHPTLVSLLDDRARAQMALGQYEAALETMRARRSIKDSLQAQVLEAREHLARGDAQAALDLAAQTVSQYPGSAVALALLGDVHLARGDADHALSAYQRLQSVGQGYHLYLLGMMDYYEARGERVTASSYAVRVQQANDPEHPLPVYYVRRLRDYYRRSGEANRAQDLDAHLAERYERELAEIQAALHGRPLPQERAKPSQPPASRLEPEPQPITPLTGLFVSDEERARLEVAARERFGHASLLPGQAETMTAILRGQDVLTILPTGGGKSLCYQLPASLDRRGLTLVVSPLIALMKDQVESLPAGVRLRTCVVNSTLEGDELQQRIAQIAHGNYCLVYAAPERLRQTPFVRALRLAGINRLVVDEAHCVSLWGHDFRPDYLYLGRVRAALGHPPVLAMTATAPPRVRRDILQRLGSNASVESEMSTIAGDSFRPNLFFEVVRVRNADEKMARLLALCSTAEGSGIVYVNSRDRAERLAQLLSSRGIAAGFYHAGIGDRDARDAAQDHFMRGEVRVMVATIAFGMGIDKPDIRFIVHYDLPSSLETYYQEAGRAGRDGGPAHCILFYAPADRGVLTLLAKKDALSVEMLRAIYGAVRRQLQGAALGRVVLGDVARELEAEETPVRVALGMLEEVGLLRRHQDIPRAALVRRPPHTWRREHLEGIEEAALGAFTIAARLETGECLRLDLLEVARKMGRDPLQIEERVLHWADAGILEYRPSGRDALIELLPAPADASARVEALLDRYATIQGQRIDEVVAYAKAGRCRHGHISAYLSGQERLCRSSCDHCAPDRALSARAGEGGLPGEEEQMRAILRCALEAPWSWGRGSLASILRGEPDAPERGRESSAYGALSFRSQSAVEKLVDSLVGAGMFHTRTLENGGVVLDLTPAGRSVANGKYPEKKAEKYSPPETAASSASAVERQEGAPLAGADHDLMQRLRAWRLEAAKAQNLRPFVVAHDSLLARIVAVRPSNMEQLAAIKGMGDKKLASYGTAILSIVNSQAEVAPPSG